MGKHQAQLMQHPLAGEQLHGEGNHKPQHRQAAVPALGPLGPSPLFNRTHGVSAQGHPQQSHSATGGGHGSTIPAHPTHGAAGQRRSGLGALHRLGEQQGAEIAEAALLLSGQGLKLVMQLRRQADADAGCPNLTGVRRLSTGGLIGHRAHRS